MLVVEEVEIMDCRRAASMGLEDVMAAPYVSCQVFLGLVVLSFMCCKDEVCFSREF